MSSPRALSDGPLLVAGAGHRDDPLVRSWVEGGGRWVHSGREALAAAKSGASAIIVAGELEDMTPRGLVTHLGEFYPTRERCIGVGPWTRDMSAMVYCAQRPVDGQHLRELVAAVCGTNQQGASSPHEADLFANRAILEEVRRLGAQTTLRGARMALERAGRDLATSDDVTAWFHDADDRSLFQEESDDEAIGHSDRGVAGFAVVTRQTVLVRDVESDGRYDEQTDRTPHRAPHHLLVAPVVGPEGDVDAVLVVARGRAREPFDEHDAAVIERFASLAGPTLHALSLQLSVQDDIDEALAEQRGFFREEAFVLARSTHGSALRVTPPWVARTHWTIVALVLFALAYLSLGTVRLYSRGPAVVRFVGTTQISSTLAGTITWVGVQAGQVVEEHQVIARLDDVVERSAVERVEREFDQVLASSLQDPGNLATRRRLAELRAELHRARALLEQRQIRSPRSGRVTDIRARIGEQLEPGEAFASVAGTDGAQAVIAFLPADDRPHMRMGQEIRFDVEGFRFAQQRLLVTEIGEEALGAEEAQRVLGDRLADAIALDGAVVPVRAMLPSRRFESDKETYQFFDGMRGEAKMGLRDERIIFALSPGLKRMLEEWIAG